MKTERGVTMTMRLSAVVFELFGITETDNLLNTGVPGYITTKSAEVLPGGNPMGMAKLTQLCTEMVKKLVNRILELQAENAQLRQQLEDLKGDG